MTLTLPNEIHNDTPADAVPVEQNYSVIEGYINTNCITRDGAVAMTAQLKLVGDPVNPTDAATKSYVDALLPVGVMLPFGGEVAPAGQWAVCNGASLAVASYGKLHEVIGYRYGGSGGTFMVPDLTGRVPVGKHATRTDMNATGKRGGSYTLGIAAHSHTMPHTHTIAHTHEHPHTHTINHDHGSVNTSNPLQGHRHDMSMRQTNAPGTTGSAMQAGTAGTTTSQFTGNDDTVHQHAVNLPAFSGPSGGASDATTGAASVANTGASSAASTTSTGTAGIEQISPFVVVSYIIRVA